MSPRVVTGLALLLLACGPAASVDAGTTGGGGEVGGGAGGGSTGGGSPSTGGGNAGGGDAGGGNAGGGAAVDAGGDDAGSQDAGSTDAGVPDAGSADAGQGPAKVWVVNAALSNATALPWSMRFTRNGVIRTVSLPDWPWVGAPPAVSLEPGTWTVEWLVDGQVFDTSEVTAIADGLGVVVLQGDQTPPPAILSTVLPGPGTPQVWVLNATRELDPAHVRVDGGVVLAPRARLSNGALASGVTEFALEDVPVATVRTRFSTTLPPGGEWVLVVLGSHLVPPHHSQGLRVVAVSRSGAVGPQRPDPRVYVSNLGLDGGSVDVFAGSTRVAAGLAYGQSAELPWAALRTPVSVDVFAAGPGTTRPAGTPLATRPATELHAEGSSTMYVVTGAPPTLMRVDEHAPALGSATFAELGLVDAIPNTTINGWNLSVGPPSTGSQQFNQIAWQQTVDLVGRSYLAETFARLGVTKTGVPIVPHTGVLHFEAVGYNVLVFGGSQLAVQADGGVTNAVAPYGAAHFKTPNINAGWSMEWVPAAAN